MNKVFVYGSLKQGFGNHPVLLNENTKLLGKGFVNGFEMYSLGGFPGIKAVDEPYSVLGELYELDGQAFASCDRLEGHPTFYCRELTNVTLEDGSIEEAWIYVYQGNVSERDFIPDGEWLNPQWGR